MLQVGSEDCLNSSNLHNLCVIFYFMDAGVIRSALMLLKSVPDTEVREGSHS